MPRFPDGHFYSPVPDFDDLRRHRERIWRPDLTELPGVDLNVEGQKALLESLRDLAAEFDYPEEPEEGSAFPQFHEPNGLFEGIDSRMLFCLLRHLKPSRVVEVGSGFSSLLLADVNRSYFDGGIDITCVEPYPRSFLREGVSGINRLMENRVEDVGLDLFQTLEAGDILFIDSSHVLKTGNDVHYLYLDIMPQLAKGVVIHCHDIFLPYEYPEQWILDYERGWNEQYLLRAVLMFSRGFRVLFGSVCAHHLFPELTESMFGKDLPGGSFWMEKVL